MPQAVIFNIVILPMTSLWRCQDCNPAGQAVENKLRRVTGVENLKCDARSILVSPIRAELVVPGTGLGNFAFIAAWHVEWQVEQPGLVTQVA